MFVQSYPSWFQLDITNKCNMKCKMCPRVSSGLNKYEMKFEDYKKIINILSVLNVDCLALTGMGEPFMHAYIFDMIKYAKESKMPVSITTNGLLLNTNLAKQIIDLDVNNIRFSVDQIQDLHSENLHEYSIDVLDNIKNIVRLRNKKSNSNVNINVNTVISLDNINHMFSIIKWCKESGVDFVNLIKLSTRVNTIKKIPTFLEEYYFKMYHLYALCKNIELKSTYLNRKQTDCGFLKNFLFIMSNGDVSPCCHLYNYIVGNIFEQSIDEIWNGQKFAHFRENWLKICGGCNLMMWNHRGMK